MKTDDQMLDITAPQSFVEVLIRKDGRVLWVNIDGVCRLRVCRISSLSVEDHRTLNTGMADLVER